MNKPYVSILMTAYNRQKYIAAAIESVLNSTYDFFELIIVDDCSTDLTATIVETYAAQDDRITFYRNAQNLGQFKNRNKAANYAKGTYLKFVDSDDLIYPYTIDVMVQSMMKYPEAGLGFCHTIGDSSEPFPFLITPESAYKKHYFGGGLLYTGPIGLIIKTEAFREVNQFENFGMPSDNHLSLKIAARYSSVALPRDLFWWRLHNEGQAFDQLSTLKNLFDHFNFNKDILTCQACPLSVAEKALALASGRKNFSRGVLRWLAKKPGDLKVLRSLLKQHNISVPFVVKNLV